jgi:hypothetical protein
VASSSTRVTRTSTSVSRSASQPAPTTRSTSPRASHEDEGPRGLRYQARRQQGARHLEEEEGPLYESDLGELFVDFLFVFVCLFVYNCCCDSLFLAQFPYLSLITFCLFVIVFVFPHMIATLFALFPHLFLYDYIFLLILLQLESCSASSDSWFFARFLSGRPVVSGARFTGPGGAIGGGSGSLKSAGSGTSTLNTRGIKSDEEMEEDIYGTVGPRDDIEEVDYTREAFASPRSPEPLPPLPPSAEAVGLKQKNRLWKDLPEVVKKGLADSLPKEEVKRQEVIFEFVYSEEA